MYIILRRFWKFVRCTNPAFGALKEGEASRYHFYYKRFGGLPTDLPTSNYRQKSTVSTMSAEVEEKITREGDAEVFLPTSVFYTPVQEFNRDLTIAVISQHAKDHYLKTRNVGVKHVGPKALSETNECDPNSDHKEDNAEQCNVDSAMVAPELESGKYYENGIRILEGLAATGLRSIRFALEVPGVKEVIANDFDLSAVEFIQRNCVHNRVEHLLKASHADAAMLMYQSRNPADRFDVIDLDPYGTPAPFLDAAVQAVKDGGLLCVTCTDMAVLCGNAPETCHAKYGSFPVRTRFCHEQALRIVLRCIESHANKYSRYIEPLLAISVDFYVRFFVRVYTGAKKVKESVTKLSNVYSCNGCGGHTLQPLATRKPIKGVGNFKYFPATNLLSSDRCPTCSSHMHMGGPIWSYPLHNVDFVKGLLTAVMNEDKDRFGTSARIIGMLSVVLEELTDVPLYYVADELCKVLHVTPPNVLQLRSGPMLF